MCSAMAEQYIRAREVHIYLVSQRNHVFHSGKNFLKKLMPTRVYSENYSMIKKITFLSRSVFLKKFQKNTFNLFSFFIYTSTQSPYNSRSFHFKVVPPYLPSCFGLKSDISGCSVVGKCHRKRHKCHPAYHHF